MHRISLQDVSNHKSYSGFGLNEKRLSPNFIHPFEPDVVVFKYQGRNVEVNVKAKRVVRCSSDHHFLMVGSFCIFSVGSFVIPTWPVVFPSHLCAALAKEQGNVYLKAEQFHEAIFWYSKSIAIAPSPASYANRALAYFKVDMFNEAENDYSQALTLDNEYFKVHGRPASPSWVIVDKVVRVNLEPTGELTKFERTSPPNVSTFCVAPYRLVAKPGELETSRHKFPSIIASCNGLVLFAIKFIGQEDRQFIANPVTDYWAPILNPHRHSLNRKGVGFVARVDSSGVLEKFLVAEYRVVGSSRASLMCFSSDSAEWVEKSANYMLGKHKWRYDGAFEFDGSLFWIDLSIGLITWGDCIGGVEDAKERVLCRFIQFPIMCWREADEVECKRVVGVSGGCIHFVETNNEGDCLVSILKNNKGDEQWTLIHKLSFKDLWSHDSNARLGLKERRLTPSFIHPFNSDVVVFETESRNVAVNVRTRKTESCGDPHFLFVGTFFIFSVGSFVVPPQLTLLPASLCSTLSKAQGNEYFKAKQYHEAIFWYCRSIDVAPSPAAYANRALANLKVSKFNEAENDCTEALVLDGDCFKVYGRRAVARKELGNLEGSLADIQSALNLQPQNAELKKLHAEVLSLLKKASTSRRR